MRQSAGYWCQVLYKGGVRKMLIRLLAGTLLFGTATFVAAENDQTGPFWSLMQTYNQIQRCIGWSDYEMKTTRIALFNLHWIPISSETGDDTLVDCLSSGTEIIAQARPSPTYTVIVYLPPHNNGYTVRGAPHKIPELLIVGATEVTIIPSSGDHGVEDILHVSNGIFLVQIGIATHSRIYRIDVATGETSYVASGHSMEIADPIVPTFRVNDTKSYFKLGGALWIDVIVDEDGHILDIVTPSTDLYVHCVTVIELSETTNLDLSRMDDDQKVCIRR